jgi:hypothetical protein
VVFGGRAVADIEFGMAASATPQESSARGLCEHRILRHHPRPRAISASSSVHDAASPVRPASTMLVSRKLTMNYRHQTAARL